MSSAHPAFFQLHGGEYLGGWYWMDDECEEPMGPFESQAEAEADRVSVRPGSSANTSEKT